MKAKKYSNYIHKSKVFARNEGIEFMRGMAEAALRSLEQSHWLQVIATNQEVENLGLDRFEGVFEVYNPATDELEKYKPSELKNIR